MKNIIDSEEVLTIFRGLHLTKIDEILDMPIRKSRNLSFAPTGRYKLLKLLESEIKLFQVFKYYVLHLIKSDSNFNKNYLSITYLDYFSFIISPE